MNKKEMNEHNMLMGRPSTEAPGGEAFFGVSTGET